MVFSLVFVSCVLVFFLEDGTNYLLTELFKKAEACPCILQGFVLVFLRKKSLLKMLVIVNVLTTCLLGVLLDDMAVTNRKF